MKKLRISLKSEIAVNLAMLLFVALIFLSFLVFSFVQDVIVGERLLRAREVSSLTALRFQEFLERRIASGQPLLLSIQGKAFLETLYSNGEEVQVTIWDAEARPVAGEKTFNEDLRMKNMVRRSLIGMETIEEIKGITQNLFYGENTKIIIVKSVLLPHGFSSAMSFTYRLEDLWERLRSFYIIIGLFVFIDTVIVMVFGYMLLSRIVIQPISKILAATEKVAEGDFDVALNIQKGNELGDLAYSFSEMTRKLKENRDDIAAKVWDLEELNRKLKAAQAEVVRTEKMASIGRLAAGIAHEIGNPLGSILGFTDVLKKGKVSAEQQQMILERIQDEIHRIDNTVRRLLDYSRTSVSKVEPVQIKELLESALELVCSQRAAGQVTIRKHLPEDIVVKADAAQLRQVVVNILMNAIDAMEGSGELTVEAKQAKAVFGEDLQAKISFIDSGSGIDSEIIPLIFDPFFTTKEVGKGTGLGLAISQRIIDSFGGEITVESSSSGTTFTITLPLHKA